jgi:hypothetical protein
MENYVTGNGSQVYYSLIHRTANNLKNRFYTVLRNLVKVLFRKKANYCPKLPGEIPSKDLSRLYDAKESTVPHNADYAEFQALIPTMLTELAYDLDSPRIPAVVAKYSEEIIKIYHLIYGERALAAQADHKLGHKKSDETSSGGFQAGDAVEKLGEVGRDEENPVYP